jgi:hypothetical protein
MRKIIPYLFLVPVFIGIAIPQWRCKKDNGCGCFNGTGAVTSETRQLPVFNNVYVEDNVNLIFQEDTMQKVEVQAGKHLLHNIITEVSGGVLNIHNKNMCNFIRRYDIPIKIFIHYKRNQVWQIRTKGTGTITSANAFTGDSIDLSSESSGDISFEMGGQCRTFTHQHGAGDITLTGSCDQVLIYSKGTGFTITENCVNNYTWVYTNTTGKITVDPSGLLITIIDGSGNIYYKGTPGTINNTENSTGKLLPLQ